ncbi:uncharacterized protein LOC117885375 [Trachemys scripta elegans]|uniref:uncharacterized protein LOC117885375 n=1 Tax=Trachemys scripta elegans TaxID=31138 RepID=UPI001556EA2A|nr:uncharacterized protein LOC117885375 [Trachemys scripta elegans]
MQWATNRGLQTTIGVQRDAHQHCPQCTRLSPRRLKTEKVYLKRGQRPEEVWQVDYIGPLPESQRHKYLLTAVDTYSGLLFVYPCASATQEQTIKGLEELIRYYGSPLEVQSDQGTHLTGMEVREWARGRGIVWVFHIAYHPQGAGLIERMNGLLKEQLRKLSPTESLAAWSRNLRQAAAALNDHPLYGSTPFAKFKAEVIERPRVLQVQCLHPQAHLPIRATPGSAGLNLRVPQKSLTLQPNSRNLVSIGLALVLGSHKAIMGALPHVVAWPSRA